MINFRYGERLTRNAVFKPRFDKYKNWTCKLDDFVGNKIAQLQSPASETELHAVFHRDIFPIWCLASGKDHKLYYSDKFSRKCTQCICAKLHEGIPKKGELPEDQVRFDRFVTQCAEFYQKYAYEFVYEALDTRSGKTKEELLLGAEAKKAGGTSSKKQTVSVTKITLK